MSEIVGVAEAKNDLSELLNRAAYGGERIIIGSRGKPKAAVIGIADLQKLEVLEKSESKRLRAEDVQIVQMFETNSEPRDPRAVLRDLAALRQEIAAGQHGEALPDSVALLRRMRLRRARR